MTLVAQQAARLRKFVTIARVRDYRDALWTGVAASVEHEKIPIRTDFLTVVDAGANRGQFAVFAARRFPSARLLCFEPLPGPGARLRRAVHARGRLKLWNLALGAANHEAEFHVAVADDSSSLLPIGTRQRAEFPRTKERETRRVDVRRLDSVLRPSELARPVLLKIDVQGGELGVLQGAEGLIESVDAVLVEVSFVELYDGQALADAVWNHLYERGFSCRGAWSMTYSGTGECLQGDLLFARAGFDPLKAVGRQ
jgi:FkbM family methyltransferase